MKRFLTALAALLLAAAFCAPAQAQRSDSSAAGIGSVAAGGLWDPSNYGSQLANVINNQQTSINNSYNSVVNIANNAQNTANYAVVVGSNAQNTANYAAGVAQAAQNTANNAGGNVVGGGYSTSDGQGAGYVLSVGGICTSTNLPMTGGSKPQNNPYNACPANMPWFYAITSAIVCTNRQCNGDGPN